MICNTEKNVKYYFKSNLHTKKLCKLLIFRVKFNIGFDFNVLDPLVDFYRINLISLNDCTDEFLVGGTSPINGSAQYTIVWNNYILNCKKSLF